MPKALSPCAHPGCPSIAVAGGRCAEHQLARTPRPSAAAQGYGHEWRKVRAEHLKHEPQCVVCGADAKIVDHIVPLKSGGTNDHANLRSMCRGCHGRRHRAWGRGGAG